MYISAGPRSSESPATPTANVERANSILKYNKTDLRSTMRLNALVLLYVHKDIPLHLPLCLNRFAAQHPRRMLLSDLTTEATSILDNSDSD